MTLTGLVHLLVEQFLPDSHQHYLFENYRQMDIYRVPASVVPSYLRGRPRTLIKHRFVRKTKSNKFTRDSIHETDTPSSFEIIKESGAKHTVLFCTESDDQMPSCTCKDWARWHIPCKQFFFAIFRKISDWSWESLPTGYLRSAYLTTDNKALSDYFVNQGVAQNDLSFFVSNNDQLSRSNASDNDLVDTLESSLDLDTCPDNQHLHVLDEALTCELPQQKKERNVQDHMLKARVTLQNLKTLTYNFPDDNVNLAEEFTQMLDELYHSFYSRLPNETGLIILPPAQESIRSTKKREIINRSTDYSNLPPRKKYKKSADSRVGIKADRLKKETSSMKVRLIWPQPSLHDCMLYLYTIGKSRGSKNIKQDQEGFHK